MSQLNTGYMCRTVHIISTLKMALAVSVPPLTKTIVGLYICAKWLLQVKGTSFILVYLYAVLLYMEGFADLIMHA